MNYRLFGRLLLSLWWIDLFHFRHLAAGSDRFVLLTMALAERGSVQLDSYVNNPFYASYLGDILSYQGHAYSNINPGLSFLAVPAWLAVHLVYKFVPESSFLRQEAIHYFLAHFVSFAFTTALFSAMTAWLLAVLTYRKTKQEWRGVLVGLLYGVGSIAFFFSTRLNQNIPIAFVSTCVFILTFDPQFFSNLKPGQRFSLIGFLLGWGAIIDITAMPFIGAIALILIWKNRYSPIVLFYVGLGAIVPLTGQALYHYIAFGNPFLSPSMILAQTKTQATTMNPIALGLQKIHLRSLLDYLFSAKAGLFIYMPYAALSAWYFLRYWRSERLLARIEKVAIAAFFASYFLFITLIPPSYLFHLFGPRYLLPLIPFVCLIFALYFRWQEHQLGIVLLVLGFAINISGTQLGNDTGNVFLTLAVYAIKGPWLPILDWLQKELPQSTGYSPEFVSPYGLFLILLMGLLVLWLPYLLQKRRDDGNERQN